MENHASSPLPRFSLSIDGIPLPHVPPERYDGGKPPAPLWWRVSPSGAIPPVGHAVVALCFTNAPAPFTLSLDGNGERPAAVSVPAPAPPRRRICDVAFAPRGPEVFIKVESSGVPVSSLSLDGVGTPFDVLRDGRVGRPFVLAAKTRSALRGGDRLLVEARFADGGRAMASARVLRGHVLEVQSAGAKTRKDIGADVSPSIIGAPFDDVGCYDLETGQAGAAAKAMLRHLAGKPLPNERISAVRFCTGCAVETWDTYGALADAAISSPFPILRVGTAAGRMELEERSFLHAAAASAPRPVMWTAQLFRHGATIPPPDETLSAFWMTLAMGSRGVSAYLWEGGSGYVGMNAMPEMRETWKAMRDAMRSHRDRLCPLVAADQFEAARGALRIYVAWNPGKGMLVVWRTASAAHLEEALDFGVRVPEWLAPRRVRDLVRGVAGPVAPAHGAIGLRADAGASHGAFWIE